MVEKREKRDYQTTKFISWPNLWLCGIILFNVIPYFIKKFGPSNYSAPLDPSTVLLLNIRHENNNIARALPNFLLPYITYIHDDLCWIIRDYFQSFGKGCPKTRRAEFLEEIRYLQCLVDDRMQFAPLSQAVYMYTITAILDYCQPEKWCQYDYWIHCNCPSYSYLGLEDQEGGDLLHRKFLNVRNLSSSTCTHHTNRFPAISMWGTRPRWTRQWSATPGRVVSALWERERWMPMNWQN